MYLFALRIFWLSTHVEVHNVSHWREKWCAIEYMRLSVFGNTMHLQNPLQRIEVAGAEAQRNCRHYGSILCQYYFCVADHDEPGTDFKPPPCKQIALISEDRDKQRVNDKHGNKKIDPIAQNRPLTIVEGDTITLKFNGGRVTLMDAPLLRSRVPFLMGSVPHQWTNPMLFVSINGTRAGLWDWGSPSPMLLVYPLLQHAVGKKQTEPQRSAGTAAARVWFASMLPRENMPTQHTVHRARRPPAAATRMPLPANRAMQRCRPARPISNTIAEMRHDRS
ncbi:hypothetical protein DFH06DRAFT_1123746 [Mycena polygramma]|nr:hypothetical protein DFH06DRAFT_1123746 [Mycena polygramma]